MFKITSYFVLVCIANIAAAPSRFETEKLSLGVVGGQDANRGEFPYQVSYQTRYTVTQWEHYCGGSIINESWIVLAAHCLDRNPSLSHYRVVAGILNLNDTGIETMQIKNISKNILHENYTGIGHAPNDIGLIQLATPLIFNEDVQPISLPPQNFEVIGNGTVTGWGLVDGTYIDADGPNTLQKAEGVPFINATACQNLLDNVGQGNHFSGEIMVCTGPRPTENVAPCYGDSGGPLAQNGTLIGIVVWGDYWCNAQNTPAVYTKVSHYVDWINGKINETTFLVNNL